MAAALSPPPPLMALTQPRKAAAILTKDPSMERYKLKIYSSELKGFGFRNFSFIVVRVFYITVALPLVTDVPEQ